MPEASLSISSSVQLLGIPLIYFSLTQLDKSVLVEADDEAEKERDLHRSAAANRMTFRLLSESHRCTAPRLRCGWRVTATAPGPLQPAAVLLAVRPMNLRITV